MQREVPRVLTDTERIALLGAALQSLGVKRIVVSESHIEAAGQWMIDQRHDEGFAREYVLELAPPRVVCDHCRGEGTIRKWPEKGPQAAASTMIRTRSGSCVAFACRKGRAMRPPLNDRRGIPIPYVVLQDTLMSTMVTGFDRPLAPPDEDWTDAELGEYVALLERFPLLDPIPPLRGVRPYMVPYRASSSWGGHVGVPAFACV